MLRIETKVRNAGKAKKVLSTIQIEKPHIKIIKDTATGEFRRIKEWKKEIVSFPVYRAFLYDSGKVKKEGSANISVQAYNESKSLIKKLGISDILSYKYRNITKGLAFGSYKIVADFQEKFNRKFIKPRKIISNEEDKEVFYSTRDLKQI